MLRSKKNLFLVFSILDLCLSAYIAYFLLLCVLGKISVGIVQPGFSTLLATWVLLLLPLSSVLIFFRLSFAVSLSNTISGIIILYCFYNIFEQHYFDLLVIVLYYCIRISTTLFLRKYFLPKKIHE